MSEQGEKRKSGIQRYYISSHRTSTLFLINLDGLVQKQYVVRIVDMSISGIGIESSEMIECGLVCFRDQVGGHKLGILSWCKQAGNGYRAGISFITLPYEKEQYIMNQVNGAGPHQTVRDPENIIAGLLKSIKPDSSNT